MSLVEILVGIEKGVTSSEAKIEIEKYATDVVFDVSGKDIRLMGKISPEDLKNRFDLDVVEEGRGYRQIGVASIPEELRRYVSFVEVIKYFDPLTKKPMTGVNHDLKGQGELVVF